MSYAQNFEDVMLWRVLKHVENGFYIDVGAQDPVIDSVSLAFYEHGWRGVHVEPNGHYAQLLRENRPDETVIQAAVADRSTVLRFYEIEDSGLSTCDPEIAEQHRATGFVVNETNTPCVTLANVFESCSGREIHWLKIDVEGLEDQVLQGWKPSKARPWVVVVESTLPSTQIESYTRWEKLILELDYEFVYFDGLNRFYLSKTQSELKTAFAAGPNIFDDFVFSGTGSNAFCSLSQAREKWLEGEWSAWQTKAENLDRELQAVYNSRSWRLTALLRERGLLINHCRQLGIVGVAAMSSFLRATLRYVIVFTNDHPEVKVAIRKALARFPLLETRLKAFARARTRSALPFATIKPSTSVKQIVTNAATKAEIQLNFDSVIEGWQLGKRIDE